MLALTRPLRLPRTLALLHRHALSTAPPPCPATPAPPPPCPATPALHTPPPPGAWAGGPGRHLAAPITPSATFLLPSGEHVEGEPVYGRYGHPSRLHLEATLAAVEGAAHCLTFSSGMAAACAVLDSLVPGEEVVASRHLYGEVLTAIRGLAARGVTATFLDCSEPAAVAAAVRPSTRLLWLELCTNPTLRLLDLRAVVAAVRARNPSCRILVDNTFLTPWVVRPLDLGADIVLHSLTKYINGHSDVIMGSLATNQPEVQQELEERQRHGGAAPSPFDCFLVQRSLATLHLRLERHMSSGLAAARWLEGRPEVAAVLHPLLPSHPQHRLALHQQAARHSGMLSFHLHSAAAAAAFLSALSLVRSAASLGSAHSLACRPALLTHAMCSEQERRAAGVTPDLVRLSVGLEDLEDILADLEHALAATHPI